MAVKHPDHPVTNRVDALTDGVFAIACTLLVIDLKIPDIPEQHTQAQVIDSLMKVAPSFVAFTISFFTILIYWINHDGLSKAITHFNHRLSWLNILLLFFIVLVPFPTRFIAEYPREFVAVEFYGLTMFLLGVTANLMFWYMAFKVDLLDHRITKATRRSVMKKFLFGPSLYLFSVIAGFFNIYISLAIYVVVPIIFFIPVSQETILKELQIKDE
jgi:uncharacterized membrane protein